MTPIEAGSPPRSGALRLALFTIAILAILVVLLGMQNYQLKEGSASTTDIATSTPQAPCDTLLASVDVTEVATVTTASNTPITLIKGTILEPTASAGQKVENIVIPKPEIKVGQHIKQCLNYLVQ